MPNDKNLSLMDVYQVVDPLPTTASISNVARIVTRVGISAVPFKASRHRDLLDGRRPHSVTEPVDYSVIAQTIARERSSVPAAGHVARHSLARPRHAGLLMRLDDNWRTRRRIGRVLQEALCMNIYFMKLDIHHE